MSTDNTTSAPGRAPVGAGHTARRWVLHIDMDAFFASVEQLTRPTLRGRPVLVGGTGGRGVVAGASYEARVFGARSAMPMHQARRLVGVTAVVVPPRGAVYSVVSSQVFDALRSRIPVLETLSFDEAFGEPAELAGATVAQVHEFCEQLRVLVRERTGLVASVGAGTGKQLAKIASGLAKPDGIRVISPDEQQQLLAGLPVRKLWGIGPVAEGRLRSLGIETVGAFAALPESEAVSILGGSIGAALHRLARGIDDRPVAERAEAKQISAETTYETDIVTLTQLRPAIETMAAAAHRRLEKDGRAARTVVLKLKKSDMSIVTRSFTLPYATTDPITLGTAAQRSAIDPAELGPIRLVGVSFGGLSTVRQESLFPELDQAPVEDIRDGTEWNPAAGVGQTASSRFGRVQFDSDTGQFEAGSAQAAVETPRLDAVIGESDAVTEEPVAEAVSAGDAGAKQSGAVAGETGVRDLSAGSAEVQLRGGVRHSGAVAEKSGAGDVPAGDAVARQMGAETEESRAGEVPAGDPMARQMGAVAGELGAEGVLAGGGEVQLGGGVRQAGVGAGELGAEGVLAGGGEVQSVGGVRQRGAVTEEPGAGDVHDGDARARQVGIVAGELGAEVVSAGDAGAKRSGDVAEEPVVEGALAGGAEVPLDGGAKQSGDVTGEAGVEGVFVGGADTQSRGGARQANSEAGLSGSVAIPPGVRGGQFDAGVARSGAVAVSPGVDAQFVASVGQPNIAVGQSNSSPGKSGAGAAQGDTPTPRANLWYPGMDVKHPEFGHGWVQGAGLGVVTVRFETSSTGPGPARTFAADDISLSRADPLSSLR